MRILNCAVHAPAESNLAIDALLPVAQAALAGAGLAAGEIDLIATLSVSPDHLALEPCIIGPRIGHPLQKRLDAERAYVFDLMDASLAKALHVVDIFAAQQGYRRVLLVRAECGRGVRPDADSGFKVPDGAMALLCEPTGTSRWSSGTIDGVAPLMLMLNEPIRRAGDQTGHARFAPPADIAGRYAQAARARMAELHGADWDRARYIVEHWDVGGTGGASGAGPFDCGLSLASLLAGGAGGALTLISFDPFGPAADAVTVSYGSAA